MAVIPRARVHSPLLGAILKKLNCVAPLLDCGFSSPLKEKQGESESERKSGTLRAVRT